MGQICLGIPKIAAQLEKNHPSPRPISRLGHGTLNQQLVPLSRHLGRRHGAGGARPVDHTELAGAGLGHVPPPPPPPPTAGHHAGSPLRPCAGPCAALSQPPPSPVRPCATSAGRRTPPSPVRPCVPAPLPRTARRRFAAAGLLQFLV